MSLRAEAAWGADPLEFHGGFSSLLPDPDAVFPSSITKDGRVRWSHTRPELAEKELGSTASFNVTFRDTVDWEFLQQVYGWAAKQWQGWTRGEIFVSSKAPVRVAILMEEILEFKLDGISHFGGNFLATRKVPLFVTLSHGRHILEARLIREVRSMGGIGPADFLFTIEIVPVEAGSGVKAHDLLISDVVNGVLATDWAAITITNESDEWIGTKLVCVRMVTNPIPRR